MKIKNIFLYIALILILFIFTGCNSVASPEKLVSKTTKSLEYFENKIFEVIIKLVKNEYIDEKGEIKWEQILADTENLDLELDNLIIDLSNFEISNEQIGSLSLNINNALVEVNNKNVLGIINALKETYKLIPEYLKVYNSEDKNLINKKELKTLILESYNSALNEDWETATNFIIEAENKYTEMMGDNNYIKENTYNINKIYILVQEYKTAVNSNNIELLKLKFINLIGEI